MHLVLHGEVMETEAWLSDPSLKTVKYLHPSSESACCRRNYGEGGLILLSKVSHQAARTARLLMVG